MIADSPFDFSMAGVPDGTLRVVAMRGRERLSRPFVWDVTVAGRDAGEGAFGRAALGRPARLVVRGPAGDRAVRGVIARVTSAGKHSHDRLAWRVRVVPRLALLGHRRSSRIFQDMTVKAITSAVLAEAGVAHAWETEQAEVPRGYCVQYEETDLEFLHRILAEIGVFYRFEHEGDAAPPDAPEVVVFGDRPRYRPIDGAPRLVHRVQQPGFALRLEEHHVTDFTRRTAAAPTRYTRRDHDFLRPLAPLEASASAAGAEVLPSSAEVYEHHGEFAEAEAEQRLEATALEQLRRRADVAAGASHCPRLLVGRRFTLEEHEIPGHDGDWVVTALDHEGRSPEIAEGSQPTYENRIRSVPATGTFRPARRARQFRQVMETAVVTGPPGQEIHTDAHGRIKVQFHWDRAGRRDERSSCWIRVAQSWSGSGWGFQFVPRIGMEVLVSFLGGDPDRPIVVGCVPDATHPPPYPLPENPSKSGIKTQSTPGGGGFNEILFDDAKGGELLSLRAQRNLTETALHDHLQTVGHDQTIAVAGRRTTEIRGDDALTVSGKQTWTVAGPSSLSVGGGGTATYAGARSTTVQGDDTTRIAGGQTTLAGAYSHLMIGHGLPEGHGLVYVNGNYRVAAAAGVQVASGTGLTLSCGDSSIELLPDEIKIRSKKITVVAEEELFARGKDHEIAATDHLEIRGQDIRLFAKEGQLLLDENARLNGQAVKLNCDRPRPEERSESGEDEIGTITFRVKPHFELAPGDRLWALIATPSGKMEEHEVDASMEVKLEGKKGDRFVLVDLRKGNLPFGKRGA